MDMEMIAWDKEEVPSADWKGGLPNKCARISGRCVPYSTTNNWSKIKRNMDKAENTRKP